MPRKTQQFRLYAAENEAPIGPTFDSIDAIQAEVDRWLVLPDFVAFFGGVTDVLVEPALSSTQSVGAWLAHEQMAQIDMARPHWHLRGVLHEMAHPIAELYYGSTSHDPAFAQTYLQLAWIFSPDEIYGPLRDAFIRHDIDFNFHPGTSRGIAL